MTVSTSSAMQFGIWNILQCRESGSFPNTSDRSGPKGRATMDHQSRPSDWATWLTADHRAQPRKFAPSVPLVARVLLRCVTTDNGCWLYRGSLDNGGYSCLRILGKNERGHRVTWEALYGPVPKELHLDHLCRVRHCVNPEHLEPVTMGENVFNRAFWPAGFPKLTHCQRGHEMTEDNTYHRPDGRGRQCRVCIKRRSGRQSAKRRASSDVG
jgi:hypothetical protein